ncbi:hypothetical protein TPY_0135 [Sulfobacillus acidophilus TPY]|nr:hypothetical protein TPY_0135 [Sulfobacillus acidophilus TPY]
MVSPSEHWTSEGLERAGESPRAPLKGRLDREFLHQRESDTRVVPEPSTPVTPQAEVRPPVEPPEVKDSAIPSPETPTAGTPVRGEPVRAPLVEDLLRVARMLTSLALTLESLDGLMHRLRTDEAGGTTSLTELLSRLSQTGETQRPRGDIQDLLRQYLQR